MIDVRLLLEKLNLSSLNVYNYQNGQYSATIRNTHALDLHNPHIINIVRNNELEASDSPMQGACFVIGEASAKKFQGLETVIFPEDTDPEELLRQCGEIIAEYERFCQYTLKLEEMTNYNTDLFSCFKYFAKYYDNPVCFGDHGGNIIFMDNIKEEFTDWDETIQYWIQLGYVPYEYSRQHGNMSGAIQVQSSPVPVIMDTGFAAKYHRMSYRTCKTGHTYNNYLCIAQVYRPFGYFDRDVLIFTADLISNKFVNYNGREILSPRNHFLHLLLNNAIPDMEIAQDKMNRYHITKSAFYQLVIVEFDANRTEFPCAENYATIKLKWMQNVLANFNPPVMYVFLPNQIVILLQGASDEKLISYHENLKKTFSKETFLFCYSNIYEDLLLTNSKYQETQLALSIAKKLYPKGENEFSFWKLYHEVLLYLAGDRINLHSFILDGLLKLKERDTAKGTEYFHTLYEFLICNKNLNTLANKLNIHRNTALYRIERAKEYINIDFDNFEDLTKLYMSFKCLALLENIPLRHSPDTPIDMPL